MIMHEINDNRTWPELLAAYADGELDKATRRRVEVELGKSSRYRQELRDQFALSPRNEEFIDAVSVESPHTSSWAAMWRQINRELNRSTTEPRRTPREPWRRGIMSALIVVSSMTVAAVVIAASWPTPIAQLPSRSATSSFQTEEVLPVALAGDVEIHSIREADVAQLVVGEPPHWHDVMLVTSGDVHVNSVKPAADGKMPEMQMGGWTDAPLIYAPVSRTP